MRARTWWAVAGAVLVAALTVPVMAAVLGDLQSGYLVAGGLAPLMAVLVVVLTRSGPQAVKEHGEVPRSGTRGGAGRVGAPIGGWAPATLGTHPAIGTDEAGGGGPRPGYLTAYVRRDHDEALAAVVDRAVNGGDSLAVLVGDSSTGKTRACWEALQRLPPEWYLWHPQSAEELARDAERVGPRTVVWLNETFRDYLGRDRAWGERAAQALRALLHDPDRRPVLVLGTLWRDQWAALTDEPGDPTGPDPYAHARAVLHSAEVVAVPEAFTGAEVGPPAGLIPTPAYP